MNEIERTHLGEHIGEAKSEPELGVPVPVAKRLLVDTALGSSIFGAGAFEMLVGVQQLVLDGNILSPGYAKAAVIFGIGEAAVGVRWLMPVVKEFKKYQ